MAPVLENMMEIQYFSKLVKQTYSYHNVHVLRCVMNKWTLLALAKEDVYKHLKMHT